MWKKEFGSERKRGKGKGEKKKREREKETNRKRKRKEKSRAALLGGGVPKWKHKCLLHSRLEFIPRSKIIK